MAGYQFRTVKSFAARSAFALVKRTVLAFSFFASTLFTKDNDTLEDPCVSE